jgi:hypothetical protein
VVGEIEHCLLGSARVVGEIEHCLLRSVIYGWGDRTLAVFSDQLRCLENLVNYLIPIPSKECG